MTLQKLPKEKIGNIIYARCLCPDCNIKSCEIRKKQNKKSNITETTNQNDNN